MIRRKINQILSNILSLKIFNRFISKLKSISNFFWKLKRFIKEFPWWSNYVKNWLDIILIFFNIKKQSTIHLTNGYSFKNCSKNKNWYLLQKYINLLERNIRFIHKNDYFISIIKNIRLSARTIDEGVNTVNAIFFEHEYGKFNYKDKIVMDIGGFIGDSALYFILNGAKKVYVYEPDKEFFRVLVENIKLNHLEDKIFPYNVGISNKHKKVQFENLILPGSPWESEGNYIVEILPFKDILKETIDILKMDCEGYEFPILENILKNNLIDLIREGIIMEVHDLDEKRNLKYAIDLIKRIGFKTVETYLLEPPISLIYAKK